MKNEKKEIKPGDRIKFTGNELFILEGLSQEICGVRSMIDFAGISLNKKVGELFKQIAIFRPDTDGWEIRYDHIKNEIVMQYKK